MISNLLLFLLAAGLPYFVFLEKNEKFSSKLIFLISGFSLFCAIVLSLFIHNEHYMVLVLVSFASSIFAIYKATKTTNFYKLGYYLIYINAPFFVLFEEKGALYSLSLLVALIGIFLIGYNYEKNYGSANYHYIRGITLTTPYIGTFMTIYLISVALYPPFPNSLFFLNYVLLSDLNFIGYLIVIVLFFGHFLLAMKVVKESLFGKPNPNIHYVELTSKEKLAHIGVVALLLVLSIFGLKEILI
ncbi:MAG: hypothetical protein ACOC08_02290 [Campylobacterales bacterium]